MHTLPEGMLAQVAHVIGRPQGGRGKERRLQTAALLQAAIAVSPIAVTIADMRVPGRPLIYVNAAFTRMTGFPLSEAYGLNCRFLQGPGTDPADIGRIRTLIDAGQAGEVTIVNHRKDGTVFTNRLQLAPVRGGDGSLVAFVGHQTIVD